MKKLLSVLMILTLLFSMAPVSMADSGVGSLEITKVFEMPEGVTTPDAAVFKLRHDNGPGNDATEFTAIATSETSWIALFENVTALGGYDLIEEELGECWENDFEDTKIKINKDETLEITVTNTYTCEPPVTTSGSITFVKEWEGDFEPESGYVNFTVNGEYPFATVEYPSWTTISADLSLGTYMLTDETVFDLPEGSTYNKDQGLPYSVTLTETTPDATIYVTNNYNPPGTVIINKTFGEPGMTTTATADFELWRDGDPDTFYTSGTAIYDETDSRWELKFEGVKAGNYVVKEVPISDWSASYTNGTFALDPGEEEIVDVTNTYDPPVVTPGSVTVHKTFEGYEGDMPIGDLIIPVEFTLYDFEGTTVETLSHDVTGGAWTGTFVGVAPGAGYYVEETDMSWEGDGSWTWIASPTSFDVDPGADTGVDIVNTYNTCSVDIDKTVSPSSMVEGTGTVEYKIDFKNTSVGQTFNYVILEEGPEGWFTTGNVSNLEVGFIEHMSTTHELSYAWEDLFDEYLDMTTFGGFEPGDVMSISFDYDITGLEDGSYTNIVTGTAMKYLLTDSTVRVPYPNGDCMMAYAVDSEELTIEPVQEEHGTVVVTKQFTGADTPEEIYIEYQLWADDGPMMATASAVKTGEGWVAEFTDVDPGDYYIVEVPVPGWTLVAYDPDGFTLQSGKTAYVMVVNDYNDVPTYGVEIDKKVSPLSHYTGGGPVSYTITFENIGNTATYDWVDFDDLLDEGMTTGDMFNTEAWIDGEFITGDGGKIFGASMDMTSYGGFEPGDVITITYDYDSSGLGIGTYNNTITGCAWMGGIVPPYDDLMFETSRDIAPAISQPICATATAFFDVDRRPVTRDDDPGVRIEKTVDVDEASVGDTVTYTIKVTNNGDVSLFDVEVVDGDIGVTWEIGDLGKNDSISEDFEYEIQETDFVNGEFENIAEVTADSREGKASDTDNAVVEEEPIDVPPVTPPETPPEVVVPPAVPPQALPQTGQSGIGLIYGMGSAMLLAGVAFGRKKRR